MTSWCPDMFEDSPKRNTKRLFLYAADQIAESLRRKYGIAEYVSRHYEYLAHMAWLIGATSAAQALIREVDVVTNAWAPGNADKALSMVRACAPHLISVWFGGIDRDPRLSGKARAPMYEAAASSMLDVINRLAAGGRSGAAAMTARNVRDAVSMDRQWRREQDAAGEPLAYASILLCLALEACGRRSIEWSKVPSPLQSLQDLADSNALADPEIIAGGVRPRQVIHCLEEGVGSARRFHTMNIEGKVRPPSSQ